MRLIDLKRNIDFAFDNFNLKFTNSNGNYFIENVLNGKKAINALVDCYILPSGFKGEEDFINTIQSSFADRIIVDSTTHSTYLAISRHVSYMLNCLFIWTNEHADSKETDTTINIKLPNISNLNDLASTSIMLKKAFSQVVADVGGEVKVKQLDHGSYWVIVDVTTIEAVALVGSLVWSAVKVIKVIVETMATYQQYVNYKLGNDALRAVKSKNEEIVKLETRQEAEKINKEHFKDENPERCGRIAVSIDELCKLIRAGGEIHPASHIENKNKDEYPDYTKLLFTQKSISEIDSKEKGSEISEENDTATV